MAAGFMAAAMIVNALTVGADYPHAAAWKPWVLEATSTIVLALLVWIPGLLIRRTAAFVRGRRASAWLGAFGVHAAGVTAFSGLHVLGMLTLRGLLYAAAGDAYPFTAVTHRLLYEFRKDVLTYVVLATVFALIRPAEPKQRPAADHIDIRDGARVIRAAPGEILAAASAGNYVEFILADGRRPLVRATLTAMERELAAFGFVRTHRSWLINPERVTGLRRQGAGDWSIELGDTQAPLSRRYPEALARLKPSGSIRAPGHSPA
jgi:DNA-binding LytR/AlgR family response regulator